MMQALTSGHKRLFPWEQMARWACVVLCLGLFWGYIHALGRQPLWWDEGSSIHKALLSPSALLRLVATTDDHPPGYYLLLRGWMTFLGTSPFATRLLGVFSALCLAPLLYAAGKHLDRRSWTGVAAAAIGALLPFVVQHAREVRMYTLETALAAAAMYAFLRLLSAPGGQRRWWAGYVAVVIAGLHIHYAFALLCAAQGVAVLAAWRLKRTRLMPWLMAAGVVAVAYLPWLSYTGPRFQALLSNHLVGTHGPRLAWQTLLPVVQQGLMEGWSSAWSGLVLAGAGLAVLTGGVALFRRRLVAALCLSAGVAEAVLLMVVLQRQEANIGPLAARQIFFSLPLLAWLAAIGLRVWAKASRWLSAAAAVFLVFSLVWNLPISYRSPVNPPEDYRPLIAQVAAAHQPQDAVWTNYEWQEGYFDSYAPRLPFTFYRGVAASSTVTDTLESLFAQHPRLWVVNYKADVHDLVDYPLNAWLHDHALLAFESWYDTSHLALFERAPAPPSAWPGHAVFEKGITLDYQPVARLWHAGDILTLSLRWQAAPSADQPYSIFIHVRRPDSQPFAQSDYSTNNLRPGGAWAQGRPVLDQQALLLPPDLAPGVYAVYVGLYNPQTPNERFKVAAPSGCDLADSVCVGTIEIAGPGGRH